MTRPYIICIPKCHQTISRSMPVSPGEAVFLNLCDRLGAVILFVLMWLLLGFLFSFSTLGLTLFQFSFLYSVGFPWVSESRSDNDTWKKWLCFKWSQLLKLKHGNNCYMNIGSWKGMCICYRWFLWKMWLSKGGQWDCLKKQKQKERERRELGAEWLVATT